MSDSQPGILNAHTKFSWRASAIYHFALCGVVVIISLAVNQVYASDKPVIAYADKNGVLGVGAWNIQIQVFSDGKVHYFGDGTMVYEKGDRYSKISKAKLNKLIREFLGVRFFEIKVTPSLMDLWHPPLKLPPVMWDQQAPPAITFNYENQVRTVSSRDEFIYSLQESIFRTVNLKHWVCYPPSHSNHEQCNYWYNN